MTNASTLLNTWTRILSQTEHNQRLILNKDWNGATKDLEEVEAENLERELARQRECDEAERRRQDARRRQEEQERARLVGTTSSGMATTGRGRGRAGVAGTRGARTTTTRGSRGILRGGTTTSGSGVGGAGAGSSGLGSRAGSQIGRGFGVGRTTRGTRGTGRGAK